MNMLIENTKLLYKKKGACFNDTSESSNLLSNQKIFQKFYSQDGKFNLKGKYYFSNLKRKRKKGNNFHKLPEYTINK